MIFCRRKEKMGVLPSAERQWFFRPETFMKQNPLAEPEAILRASGEGEMQQLELFSGIALSKNHFHAERICMEHEAHAKVLEINYCRSGRIGWDMKNGFSVYLGPGDMDVHTMDDCAVSTISLPLGHYEGITVIVDLEQLQNERFPLLAEAQITQDALLEKLRQNKRPFSLPASKEIDRIFSPLYEPLPTQLYLPYCKLKALELLLYLARLEPAQEKQLNQYYSSQVERIKDVHALLTQDLQKRYTIEELSRQYLINTSTLKAIFKTVYSQSIGAYMKEYRIHRAMELLRTTDDSIADIARQVGYESQGKFTAAFKDISEQLPSAYRKQQEALRPERKIL